MQNHNSDSSSHRDLVHQIMARVASLPLSEQAEAIHTLISDSMKEMPTALIHEMRAEIADQFPVTVPIVESTLDLIDGQLALREINTIS